MTKSKRSSSPARGPSAEADRLAKTIFDQLTARPLPDHLVELADELEIASKTGRLRRPSQAA
jgi:hypothetical protein